MKEIDENSYLAGYNACIGDFRLEVDSDKYVSELKTLIDSALPIVEIFKCESPAQKEWKKRWIEKAREVTDPKGKE